MKRMRVVLMTTMALLACACLYCPIFHAMPRFMDRYDADQFAKPDLKGKCTVCHTNDEGFGPLNAFGKAFAESDYKITPALRDKAPEMFATGNAAAKPAQAEFDAKAFYAKSCAACHGNDGKGGDRMMGIPNFADAGWQQRHSDEKMREVIVKGKGQMPSFKDKLTDDQLQAVIGYIRKFPN